MWRHVLAVEGSLFIAYVKIPFAEAVHEHEIQWYTGMFLGERGKYAQNPEKSVEYTKIQRFFMWHKLDMSRKEKAFNPHTPDATLFNSEKPKVCWIRGQNAALLFNPPLVLSLVIIRTLLLYELLCQKSLKYSIPFRKSSYKNLWQLTRNYPK